MRRFCKWFGLAACVLLLVAWGFSLVGLVGHTGSSFIGEIYDGQFVAAWLSTPQHEYVGWTYAPGWTSPVARYGLMLPELVCEHGITAVRVPLWVPLLVMGALMLWRHDRRQPLGHCACGYDLQGNTSGRCPECGACCALVR